MNNIPLILVTAEPVRADHDTFILARILARDNAAADAVALFIDVKMLIHAIIPLMSKYRFRRGSPRSVPFCYYCNAGKKPCQNPAAILDD